MGMNRRNVLIGLGAITAGGGALVGTGAFSTVEAERTVDITVSGDSSAQLGLSGNSGVVATETNSASGNFNVIRISASNLNADAKTTFSAAFTVDNNSSNSVQFYVDDSTSGVGTALEFKKNSDGTEITSSSTSGNTVSLAADGNAGETADIDIVVDLTGTTDDTDLPSTVTFVAT